MTRNGSHCDGLREGRCRTTESTIKHVHRHVHVHLWAPKFSGTPAGLPSPISTLTDGLGDLEQSMASVSPFAQQEVIQDGPVVPLAVTQWSTDPPQPLNVAPAPPTALLSAHPASPSVPQPTTSYLCPRPSSPFSSCPPGQESRGVSAPVLEAPKARDPRQEGTRCPSVPGLRAGATLHPLPSAMVLGGLSGECPGRGKKAEEPCPGSARP